MKSILTFIILVVSNAVVSNSIMAKENKDWHTQSNYQAIISTHVHLDLAVDFKQKQLTGYIEHHLKKLDESVDKLQLDTRALDIHKVELLIDNQWQAGKFQLAELDSIRGNQLTIPLTKNTAKVRVHYNSRPEASGLQWLTPEQTAGKKHPFMFSQSQAIHARSWMPIQDTPAMRVTYSATIKTEPTLRPVMSANNTPQRNQQGVYQFEMPQAIPPYLIAIAAGDIHHKKMSKQTAIYSETAYLDSAASEFSDTQAMIDAAEKLYGEYRWDQYDLLILPPSFPFGGMENPRLSFITPTVIAGDKSLVSLIAHELAHSWSGNLVTNATWRDLWLNEGFTSYVENRIMEVIFGKDRAVMEQALAAQDLIAELEELPKGDSILHVAIKDRDPDDAFSGVPYTKGQLFLMFLEQRFGREKFDPFVRKYFDDHAFQSLDTEGFVKYLKTNLLIPNPGVVSDTEINRWIYAAGMPAETPKPTSNAFVKVQQHIDHWTKNNSSLADIPTANWTIHEWLYFINNLPADISLTRMAALDKAFNLTNSTNNEVAHAWLLLSIKRQYSKIEKRLEDYLISIGRRKLIVPLYKELIKNKQYYQFVKGVYKQARPGYHPLAQGTIDALFEAAK
ncbi:M1 family metallopeptidase [Aliikangiella coralliicola]|uniref:Aminopeptidase N n=1 Tax=Aliikangiella coralliicola TaxID=2592383 RepID=A0A545UBV7_9GAMM|nr:M1 family metallopeptidase [Aliikangiella coralliicola]TQV86949.1 M1 family metallopeptidase [Aliikangiella coralliicola]